MKSADEMQSRLTDFLDKHPEIQCCYLFGSAVTSKFHSGSDLDIAIATDTPLPAQQKQLLRDELEQHLDRDVDLVDLQRATGNILRHALHGNCILCRNGEIRYLLMKRLIYDQEDMQPIRNRIMEQRRKRFAYGH